MKKLSVVVIVLLFVSMVSYGQSWVGGSGVLYVSPLSGKVGIGLASPVGKLHVSSGTSGDAKLYIESDTDNNNENDNPMLIFRQDGGIEESAIQQDNNALRVRNSVSNGGITFETGTTNGYENAVERMRIKYNGNVGIGTTSPDYKLDVNGTIQMGSFKLPAGASAGYVLTSDGNGVGTWQVPTGGGGSSFWLPNGDNIYYDVEGGNVGIGTTTPTSKLSVMGGDGVAIYGECPGTGGVSIGVYGKGNASYALGIGVQGEGPDYGLYGRGHIGVYGKDIGGVGVGVYGESNSVGIYGTSNNVGVQGKGDIFDFYAQSSNGKSYFAGNVGIGTINPQSELAVNGTITAKEIEVQTGGWPDFVFEDDYKLMSLDKLEEHIKKEKSLPGIPTSEDAATNGVKVGDMQAKLLEKVEELTLYVIEQNKELTELKEEVGDLREENKTLRQEMSSLSN